MPKLSGVNILGELPALASAAGIIVFAVALLHLEIVVCPLDNPTSARLPFQIHYCGRNIVPSHVLAVSEDDYLALVGEVEPQRVHHLRDQRHAGNAPDKVPQRLVQNAFLLSWGCCTKSHSVCFGVTKVSYKIRTGAKSRGDSLAPV